MILPIIIFLALAYLFYHLFIRGAIFPFVFFVFASWGGKIFLETNIHSTTHVVATFMSWNISWALLISAFVVGLGIRALIRNA